MSRREEVEEELDAILRKTKRPQLAAAALARTLASEVDAMRGENERIRQNHGCARHQHTTQFCAEAAERDAVITKLLAMLEPGTRPEWHKSTEVSVWKFVKALHARACKIAGRKE